MRADREKKERILIHLNAAEAQLKQALSQLPEWNRQNHRMTYTLSGLITQTGRCNEVVEGWRV